MPECPLNQAMLGVRNGDSASFQIVYNSTRQQVYLICFRVCRDQGVADDLTADVFGIVWQKANTWQTGLGSVEGWVRTIARNRAIDWKRRQDDSLVTVGAPFDNIADDAPLPESDLIRAQEYEFMRLALQGLPTNQRAAIEAAFFGDTTYAALAHDFDVPVGTMKAWIRRGLAKMRDQLTSSFNQS